MNHVVFQCVSGGWETEGGPGMYVFFPTSVTGVALDGWAVPASEPCLSFMRI